MRDLDLDPALLDALDVVLILHEDLARVITADLVLQCPAQEVLVRARGVLPTEVLPTVHLRNVPRPESK